MTQLFQRAAHDWLELRRRPDARARERASDLIGALNQRFIDSAEISIIDLGAGSGANLMWLAQHLTSPQRWKLVDRDADLLEATQSMQTPQQVLGVDPVLRCIDQLSVAEVSAANLVTASAVLDVLSFAQLDRLAALLGQAQTPTLFSLNVTGEVSFRPAELLDSELTAAFNEHQHRSSLAGPQAADYLTEKLERSGFIIQHAETDWLEGTSPEAPAPEEMFVERYLSERVAASLEHRPDLTEEATAWLQKRLSQLQQGELTVRVGHRDILALPT